MISTISPGMQMSAPRLLPVAPINTTPIKIAANAIRYFTAASCGYRGSIARGKGVSKCPLTSK